MLTIIESQKMTVNGIYLVGYALGQIVSTQFWKVKYRPRNTVPWAILLVCRRRFIHSTLRLTTYPR